MGPPERRGRSLPLARTPPAAPGSIHCQASLLACQLAGWAWLASWLAAGRERVSVSHPGRHARPESTRQSPAASPVSTAAAHGATRTVDSGRPSWYAPGRWPAALWTPLVPTARRAALRRGLLQVLRPVPRHHARLPRALAGPWWTRAL